MSGTTSTPRLAIPVRAGNRMAYLVVAGVLFIALVVGVALWGQSMSPSSRVAAVPSISPLPGNASRDQTLKDLAQEDAARRAAVAEAQKGSYIASLRTAETVPNTTPALPAPVVPTTPASVSVHSYANPVPIPARPASAVTPRSEEPERPVDPRYAALFATLVGGMAPHGSAMGIEESLEFLKQKAEDRVKQEQMPAISRESGAQAINASVGDRRGAGATTLLMSAMRWSMGKTVLATDTDGNGGPVVVEMIGGPLRGARLLGSAQRRGERMGVSLTSMSWNGKTLPVDAVLISPETKESSIASSVDRHLGERLLYPSLAALASGVGTAVSLSGSSSYNSIYGSSRSYSNFNPEQIAAIGVGAAGNNLQKELQEMAPKGPTVKLDADVPVGVMFLKDVLDNP